MRRLFLSALVAALFVPACLTAQKASYTFFGTGCQNKNSKELVLFGVRGRPKLGGAFYVRAYSSFWSGLLSWPTGTTHFIITGFSNKNFATLRLPFDTSVLTRMPIFNWCGHLRTSIISIHQIPRTKPPSVVETAFYVPNDRMLLGLHFFQQVWELQWSEPPAPLSRYHLFSRGGHGVIGS